MSNKRIETVSVVGLGYTGLPTAIFMASNGLKVIGVDIDPDRIKKVAQGELPFYEPGLEPLLSDVIESGYLSVQQTTPQADAYIVAVPTPFNQNRQVDTQYIMEAAHSIATKLKGNELIVLESTAPPGTTKWLAELVMERRTDLTLEGDLANSVYFAHAPERVLPGNIVNELAKNSRVIGGLTERAAKRAQSLYSTFSEGKVTITEAATAEMVKLVENTYRDVNLAFANELSIVCDAMAINVWELIALANQHPRVDILQPGPGVGGHCVAVDPWFIISAAPDVTPLMRAARERNESKPEYIIAQALKAVNGLDHPKIACLGLSFKADVDDIRRSPALYITKRLAGALPNARISSVDPHLRRLPESLQGFNNIHFDTVTAALTDVDIVLLLVDHRSFKELDPELLANSKVIDTRGIWPDANNYR